MNHYFFPIKRIGRGPVVRTPCSLLRAQVQFLVRGLRSHEPDGIVRKKRSSGNILLGHACGETTATHISPGGHWIIQPAREGQHYTTHA